MTELKVEFFVTVLTLKFNCHTVYMMNTCRQAAVQQRGQQSNFRGVMRGGWMPLRLGP